MVVNLSVMSLYRISKLARVENTVEIESHIEIHEKQAPSQHDLNYWICLAPKENAFESVEAMESSKSGGDKIHNLQCLLGKFIHECTIYNAHY